MSQKEIQLTQRMLLDVLQDQWSQYVSTYQKLTPAGKEAFLKQQGYESFRDLLAHICAWWEEALKIILSILDTAEISEREYDIDAFNKEAILNYKDWKETDLIAHFENLREVLLDLVADLTDENLNCHPISGWFYACVLEHAEDHKIA